MAYKIRRTCREDWRELRELRLAALADPVAPVAFFERHEKAARLPQRDWERRASGDHDGTVTFIGEDENGRWGGMLAVFLTTRFARVISVYMLPEHRGTGLAGELLRTAIAWAGGREVRLHVHENNPRAARFYASMGFQPTGESDADPRDPSVRTYELGFKPG
jgi:RimJ/RimL family protein N-acetyltransferase